MAYRVVDRFVGGKGIDPDNPANDAEYETQLNAADFVHHVCMQGVPYTKEGSNCYGSIDGLGAARGASVTTTCPVSWDEWRAASPAASMWNEWKSKLQTDRDTISETFDASTQTYTRTINWDSEGNYNKYNEVNALALGMTLSDKLSADGFEKASAACKTRTDSSRNSADSDLDNWRINNMNTRRHYKVNVSKGNV